MNESNADEMAILSRTASLLLLEEDPRSILDGIFEPLAEHLDLEVYVNYLVDPESGRLRLHSCAGLPAAAMQEIEWLDLGVAVCGTVAALQSRIVAEDVQTSEDPMTDLIRSLGVTAYACFPLVGRNKLMGTLSFGTRTRSTFNERDLSLLETMANLVAVRLERAQLISELQTQTSDLQKAIDARDELMAVISHELKNPLAVIFGGVQLIRRKANLDPEQVRELLSDIESETVRLSDVTERLLVLSKVHLGQGIQPEPLLMHHLVRRSTDAFTKFHSHRRLEVQTDEATVLAVETYVDQVIRNLLSNADKYSPPGAPIMIECRKSGSECLLCVRDFGPGVPEDQLDSIFGRFMRLEATAGQAPGVGLGLTLCQRLIEHLGGHIWATRPEGGGLQVNASLPLAQED
jgi:K+-sensing histidine kinase KdpD